MKKFILMSTVIIALGGVLGIQSAQAISLGFVPSSQTVDVGDMLSTDIVVSGLETGFNEIVSAFNLFVNYDSTILSAKPVVFGTGLDSTLPFFSIQVSDISMPGVVSLLEVSFSSDADLQAFQGDSVTLATLSFNAIDVGPSPLTFAFQNVVGLNAQSLPLTVNAGSVSSVPEPSAFLLFGTGIVGLLVFRKIWLGQKEHAQKT